MPSKQPLVFKMKQLSDWSIENIMQNKKMINWDLSVYTSVSVDDHNFFFLSFFLSFLLLASSCIFFFFFFWTREGAVLLILVSSKSPLVWFSLEPFIGFILINLSFASFVLEFLDIWYHKSSKIKKVNKTKERRAWSEYQNKSIK